jgi:hypothetical protein
LRARDHGARGNRPNRASRSVLSPVKALACNQAPQFAKENDAAKRRGPTAVAFHVPTDPEPCK